jgi:signal transduction histidine kinase/GAF domain-containing protein/ActR/RegA family two-component response regulator
MAESNTAHSEAGGTEAGPVAPADGFLLSRLQSLQEMQAALLVEEREEEILNVGIAATVEILGADLGVALLDDGADDPAGANGSRALRSGWSEGRPLARHEIEVLMRGLHDILRPIREGSLPRVLLTAGSDPALHETSGPMKARGIGSILAQAIGRGAGRKGLLVLARRDPRPYPREAILLAEILANQLAVHLDRSRRQTEVYRASDRMQEEVETATRGLRHRNLELEALNAVAAMAIPSFDLERQIESALRKAVEVTGHHAGAIYLIESAEPGEAALRLARAVGESLYLERARRIHSRCGEGALGRVWERTHPLVLADLASDPELGGCEELVRSGYHGLLCLPMRARGRTIGVMELLASTVRHYPPADVDLASAVADQVGFAVQNTRLFSDVMRYSLELEGRAEARARDVEVRDRRIEALLGILDAARRAAGADEFFEVALARLVDLTGVTCGVAHRLDHQAGLLRLRAHRGLPEESRRALETVSMEDALLGRAATGEEIVDATGLATGMPGAQGVLGAAGVVCATVIPLRSRRGLAGVLTLAGSEPAILGQDERAFLASAGCLIGLAVASDLHGYAAPTPERPAGNPQGGSDTAPVPVEIPAQLVQSQKMQSVGTLAGGIAHDFNNILGAIMGYASYIKTLVAADNPIHRHATTIEEQSERAADLTRQLLAFARGGQYHLEAVDMNRTVAEVVSFLSRSVDRNISLEVHTEPLLPGVEADAGQIRQVLLNLAVNAKDALPQGGRIIFETRVAHLDHEFVRSCPDLKPGDYVEIVVADTGIGMPADVVDRAFEPFFTTKPAGEGTGLGLSAVYGIVKNHRGHVTLSSTQGLGTTVRIYLPSGGLPLPGPAGAAVPAPAPAEAIAASRTIDDATPPSAAVAEASGGPGAVVEDPAALGKPRPAAEPPASGEERTFPDPPPDERIAISAGPRESEIRDGEPPGAVARPAQGGGRPARRTLPVSEFDPDAMVAVPLPPVRGAAGAGCVLVVDDEAAIRDMARDILNLRGYEVLQAKDGVEALDLYRQHWGRIDLVVLDMLMPRLGGLETYRRLSGMDRSVRVVLCSGYSHNEQAQRAVKEGALGLLTKPFTMTELLAWVERVLRRSSAGPGASAHPRGK